KKDSDSHDFAPVATQLTGGADPCHVIVAPNGKYIVTANYSGGSISIIPFDASDRTFGEVTIMKFDGNGPIAHRQQSPHPHFISFTPDNSAMVVDDLGTDCLHIFPLGADGYPIMEDMYDVTLSPGAGPRHLIYDGRGENAYIINELSGTVTHLRYNQEDKTLVPIGDILADYYNAGGSADIHLSPDGRFLYVSNRLKGDGIMTFAVNENDGSLSSAGFTSTGKHPRNFAITPDGKWVLVACRDENVIEVFSRNAKDGSLSKTDHDITCPKPVCIIFPQ
ncbi:MAG: lactonase family protein, partial [Muribaculaceae bacterium]|nr:lactonase family protein [Muribaculaceae bacterium]